MRAVTLKYIEAETVSEKRCVSELAVKKEVHECRGGYWKSELVQWRSAGSIQWQSVEKCIRA